MANQPTREFGKRRPRDPDRSQPVKRSNHVALLLMGSFAVGGGAYALMPGGNCGPNRPAMRIGPADHRGMPDGSSIRRSRRIGWRLA